MNTESNSAEPYYHRNGMFYTKGHTWIMDKDEYEAGMFPLSGVPCDCGAMIWTDLRGALPSPEKNDTEPHHRRGK